MGTTQKYSPIYQQFIDLLRAGLNLLDENSQQEIKLFVISQQDGNGGFWDRGGQVDLYYSMFGFWLVSALNLPSELGKLKAFVNEQHEQDNPVDRFSVMLLKQGLIKQETGKLNFWKHLLRKDYPVNFSYQMFLFLLVFDARFGRKTWLNWVMRLLLSFYQPSNGSPCSLIAALLVARHEVGLSTKKMETELMEYFRDHGFVAFSHLSNPDMLSTSVALFALQKSGFDLRVIAPPCFDFIQQNFEGGAFLSGDGDNSQDLEYTFYGLLSLGSLAKEN